MIAAIAVVLGASFSSPVMETARKGIFDPSVLTIRMALAEEAKLRSARGWRANDFPVTVTGEGSLRVQLRDPEAALLRLRRFYPIALPQATESGAFADLSREERESHILALAAAGDRFAAIKAARELYGFDLTEAKRFVDGLEGR